MVTSERCAQRHINAYIYIYMYISTYTQGQRLSEGQRGTVPSKLLGGGDGDSFVPSKNFRNIS